MSDAPPDPNTVTIPKADLATLQRSYTLLNKLWDDPERGGEVKRAAKAIDPTLRIPEIDVAEPLLKPLREQIEAGETRAKTLEEQLAAIKQEREDDKALDKLKGDLTTAQSKYRLTDDGMAEVRKIMAERNIADPMAAAAFVASEVEPAKPVTGSNFAPQDANVFGIDGSAEDASTKALHNDPVKWLDKAIPEIMSEFERGEAA